MNILQKYQKICDNMNNYIISKNEYKIMKKTKWVVMEKVHGSNFAIYFNKGDISFSKRNSLLKEGEWFYNYHIIKKKLVNNTKELAKLLNVDNFIVYGELFGGYYPTNTTNWNGPLGTRINEKGVSIIPFEERAIQEGIYYSPDIEYMVFDVVINNQFMNYIEMIDILKKTNFFYAKPLLIESYEKVMKYNINFNSTIPEQLGLDILPNNTAEGIVIKPIKNIYVMNKNKERVRCIIKIKNKKFLEVYDDFNMEEAKKSYKFIFHLLVNQNRFQSVISKIGKVSDENKEFVIEQLYQDTFYDFYTNYNFVYNDFEKVENYVRQLCQNIVLENI